MRKFKTTRRKVIDSWSNVICIGPGRVQNLFPKEDACAYTSGVYGWNADIYSMELLDGRTDTVIVTGDRPFGKISPDIETIRKYESAAMNADLQTRRRLQRDFVAEVLANTGK